MDRRVRYTRKILNESLLRFLNEKPIMKITVTEICKDADVNRSTYYSHFADPYDQFNQLKSEMLTAATDFAKHMETRNLSGEQHRYKILKGLLQYVDSQRHAFKTLLSISGDHSLQHEILTILGQIIFQKSELQVTNPAKAKSSPAHQNYMLLFASNGCFGMFYHWLMDESPADADQLARMMVEFTKHLEF